MHLRSVFLFPFFAALSAVFAAGAQPAPPNILFLFADDHSFETIRAFGHTDIDTPNLDRLVARGVTFTHAYNMGSWREAVCVASRTMLMTGRSVWRAGAVDGTLDREREAGRLWPQLLAQRGYKTYFTGKWHMPADPARAFDVVKNVRPGGIPKTVAESYNRPIAGRPDPWSPTDPKIGGFWEGGKHWSEAVADDAIGFLGDRERGAKPFFMYIAFNAPHDPRQAPREFVDRYPLDRIAVPKNFLPEYPHAKAIGCGPELRDEKLAPYPRTGHAIKVHRQEYYAMITHLDQQIGRILDTLDASGQADNTWIFFTADQGIGIGHHGLMGKQNMYEHSLRVPFIVAGPGVSRNKKIAAPIYMQDAMPTALEIAGAPRPEHVFFRSLLPLLRGKAKTSAYSAIYGAYMDKQRAVIEDGYKLIVYPEARVTRLYHLAKDPLEVQDLAGQTEHRATQRKLASTLERLQGELGDPLDLPLLDTL